MTQKLASGVATFSTATPPSDVHSHGAITLNQSKGGRAVCRPSIQKLL
jgi:hypothetical protein